MSESILNAPPSAQRLGIQSTGAHDSTTVGSERLPTASELLAAAGIEVGPGLSKKSLGYDPGLGYDDTGSIYRAERDTEILAPLTDPGSASTENRRRTVVPVVLAALAALGLIVAALAYAGSDGPSRSQLSHANGGATADVLTHELGVGLGAYTAEGLPVTLTNTAHQALSYNVTVEALDAEGRRLTADVAFVGALAPGRSTVATLFGTADGITQVELAGAQFRVVEASAY